MGGGGWRRCGVGVVVGWRRSGGWGVYEVRGQTKALQVRSEVRMEEVWRVEEEWGWSCGGVEEEWGVGGERGAGGWRRR